MTGRHAAPGPAHEQVPLDVGIRLVRAPQGIKYSALGWYWAAPDGTEHGRLVTLVVGDVTDTHLRRVLDNATATLARALKKP